MSYSGHLYRGAFVFDDAPKAPARLAANAPADTANRWVRVVRLQDAAGAPLPVTDALVAGAPLPAGAAATVATVTWKGGPRADAELLAAAEALAPGKSLTVVRAGKNLGKKNATTALTQALAEAESARKLRLRTAGTTAAAADAAPQQPRPMLLKVEGATVKTTLSNERLAEEKWYWQEKLDGVRAVAHCDGDTVRFYSRTGEEYSVAPRLRAAAAALLATLRAAAACPEHPLTHLDGELYVPGWELRRISGAARKGAAGADAGELEYHVYDAFRVNPATLEVEQQPFEQRLEQLEAAFERAAAEPGDGVRLVATHEVTSRKALDAELRRVREAGGEGLVVRAATGPYVPSDGDRRGDTTLKLKPFADAEFPLVGYADGRGKNAGMVKWIMEATFQPDDPDEPPVVTQFSADPKGITNAERKKVFEALEADPGLFEREFAGQPMTVHFATLSGKTGVPTQPKAAGLRAPENDPDWEDPVAKILGK